MYNCRHGQLSTLGAPRDMLVIGMAAYGIGFKLANASQNGYGAASIGMSTAGPYTQQSGYMAYYEVRSRN